MRKVLTIFHLVVCLAQFELKVIQRLKVFAQILRHLGHPKNAITEIKTKRATTTTTTDPVKNVYKNIFRGKCGKYCYNSRIQIPKKNSYVQSIKCEKAKEEIQTK